MRFAFTDDQIAFRDALRDLLAKECPPEVVRAAWPDGTDAHGARKGEGARAAADRSWTALAEMGVLGIAVPEEDGGLGMGPVDWVLLAEETGYAALPHPFVETALVVAPLLAAAGDPEGLLGGLLDGSTTAAASALGATTIAWGADSACRVRLDLEGETGPWRARPVGDAAVATVEAVDAGRALVRIPEPASSAPPLGTERDAALAFDRGALGTAAQLVGLGRRMLDLTVAYVSERQQFGKPVGAQQAVKHHLADAAKDLHFAAPAVHGAAWSLATGDPDTHRAVSTAKALASDAARGAGRAALQCHGAIGYTVEADLHLYLKRAESLARTWGDAAWHRGRVAWSLGL